MDCAHVRRLRHRPPPRRWAAAKRLAPDYLFGLFKVGAFTACLPCDLKGREASKRPTNNMQQTPPRIV